MQHRGLLGVVPREKRKLQRTDSYQKPNSRGRIGWKVEVERQVRQLRSHGPSCGKVRCPRRLKFSYGGWLVTRFLLRMYFIIEIWLLRMHAHCVVLKIHGGTLCSHAPCQVVCGLWPTMNSSLGCQSFKILAPRCGCSSYLNC